MTTLIGRRCTHSNVFSRPVLIGRGLGTIMPVLAMERLRTSPHFDSHILTAKAPVSGGHSGGVTPVPIPNTEVKPTSADGTWGETPWESRSPPDFAIGEAPATGASSRWRTLPTWPRPVPIDRRGDGPGAPRGGGRAGGQNRRGRATNAGRRSRRSGASRAASPRPPGEGAPRRGTRRRSSGAAWHGRAPGGSTN